MPKYFTNTGVLALQEIGKIALFVGRIFVTLFTTKGNFKPIMAQVASISLRSLPTVSFAGLFVGAIIVIQFNLILSHFDAQGFLGGLNTSAVVRSVGPLLISFLLAGKIGAYTAAEIGTMRVTEQIDAIECLGVNSIQYLILPRFIGIIISTFILLLYGLLVSIAGSIIVASLECGMNFLEYSSSITRFTTLTTLIAGIYKSLVYGSIVATISCYQGFSTTGGAKGVGRAVTLAALYTHFLIVLANYFTGTLTEAVIDAVQTSAQLLAGGKI